MPKISTSFLIQFGIVAFGAFFFITGIGGVHLFDWDEINFAESAREMLVSGDYLNVQINFHPFWEKPPLFIWMQALSMKVFGINEFAARLPNALCGVVTLLVLFNIGKKLKDIKFGLLWVAIYACSLLPFLYFKSGIIDPWFNLFIFLGIYYIILYTSPTRKINPLLASFFSAFFIGLAILTKGPVAFLIFILVVIVFFIWLKVRGLRYWVSGKRCESKTTHLLPHTSHHITFFTTLVLVGGFWFILQIINGNFTIIQDFIQYQIRLFQTEDAGHGGFFGYHFVVLFFGVFPASILALPAFKWNILKTENNIELSHFFRFMMILFWVVLLLFSIVNTKIIHYSSLCYFPLTFLAAYYVYHKLIPNTKFPKIVTLLITFIGFIFAAIAIIFPFFDKIKLYLIPKINDEFAVGNLNANSNFLGYESIFGVILIFGIILFLYFNHNQQIKKAVKSLLSINLFFIFSMMVIFVPKIENYSQRAFIEFLETKKGEDCYVYCMNWSYAHLFYTNRLPENNIADEGFLRTGNIEKPCYFIVKKTTSKISNFEENTSNFEKLYDKNGYSFYVRKPE